MSFNLPYKFQQSGRLVVVQHSHNGHIRVSPNNMSGVDGGGGVGPYAQWKIHLCGGGYIRLQSNKTGKYIRIWRGGKDIDANGGTGPFTKFKLHYHNRPNGVKLESDRFPGRYLAVNPNRSMKIGAGGHHCNLWIKRQGQPQPKVVKIVQQPKVIIKPQQGVFNAPYMFRQNNTIVIKSNYGKNLRVSPNNTLNCDGNGGTGKYAQWRVILDGMGVIKLQNTHTNKYLRIERSNAVNCGGTGGRLTRFRYHVYRNPNGVKLESCEFRGKYVAIRPNGAVMYGPGGVHTQLAFYRQGQPKPVQKTVIIQQPIQPQVIIQKQPQVIVQQPSQTYQQQQQQQQAALAQQQAALAQQQQQAALAAQQQASQQQILQQQQQMEQMKLQNEASLKQQQQQLELQKQKMQQDMEIQQQQLAQQQAQMLEAQRVMLEQQQQQQLSQSNLSNPSNPSSVTSPQNEGISSPGADNTQIVPNDEAPPSYPILNEQVQQVQEIKEEKQPEAIPIGGQDAANEVLQWLTQLKMERYYKTFIENGYDQLESIGEITKEDLKEMGVALGHIKIIVAASITAPFQNKKVKIKSVKFETYVHEYGAPQKKGDYWRCILQHNDKKDKPGCVWLFEIIEDNFFSLKHTPTGSFLRLQKPEEGIDTRSPLGPWSKLALEKDEKSKGVYYIKEIKQDNYVKFDDPRSFGYNKMSGTLKRDNNCKINLVVLKNYK